MNTSLGRFIRLSLAGSVVLTGTLLFAQQHIFDGNWEMDAAKSHVKDNRSMTLVVTTVSDGIKMTFKTKKGSDDSTSEFTTKLNGKACDFEEGSHKSQLTMWYDGSALDASKEQGPAEDVTSMWKFELSPDKQTLTLTINHYEPAGDDEKIVFVKK